MNPRPESDPTASIPDPGSFRDPTSRVYLDGDRVLRALDARATDELRSIIAGPFFRDAVGRGDLIGTGPILDPATVGLPGTWTGAVEHPRLGLWSYPTEWCFSMLRDAALLQLDLLRRALADDLTCKDATPYNIQFQGTRPVFIDIGSFEALVAGDPWYGYLQFCQLYLYPLLVQAHRDIDFQPLLRADIDGITPDLANRLLGVTNLWRKGVPVHVALHARAQRRFSSTDDSGGGDDVKARLKSAGFNKRVIEANVTGLQSIIGGLTWKRSESEWSDYVDRAHYRSDDLHEKESFVSQVAGQRRRSLVWDVGCNDGRFSRLVAPDADQVLAIDHDHLVVDLLYRSLVQDGPGNITPAVVDLSDPPPAIGWRNRERSAFITRSRPDLVLFLTVIHHLAITANVPLAETVQLLRDLDAEVVLEFPTEHDQMVKRLMRNKRAGTHDGYTLAGFEAILEPSFEIVDRRDLTATNRVLFHLRPR